MPQFRKNNRPLHIPKRKRRKSEMGKNNKNIIKAHNTETEATAGTESTAPKLEHVASTTARLPEAETQLKLAESSHTLIEAGDTEVSQELPALERMIGTFAHKLESDTEVEINHIKQEPAVFDGISNKHEHLELLEEELQASHKHSQKLQHEIDLLKAEFEAEKKTLEKNISELRRELHRTAPIEDNKFFTLSRELRDAIAAIEELNQPPNESGLDQAIDSLSNHPLEDTEPNVTGTLTQKTEEIKPVNKTVKKIEVDKSSNLPTKQINSSTQKKSGKRKFLTATALALVLLILTLYIGYQQFLKDPEVDEALINEYLEGGAVAGAETETQVPNGEPSLPAEQTVPLIDNSQAEVTLAETVWDNFVDEDFGVRVSYPVNAVKLNKTDSSITFQRKNGYIFKIQQVNTALGLNEYWKQISANNLEHEVVETKLANNDALHLILKEDTEYPGNRYLIKDGDRILDVWYATASDAFEADDISRATKMLESFSTI